MSHLVLIPRYLSKDIAPATENDHVIILGSKPGVPADTVDDEGVAALAFKFFSSQTKEDVAVSGCFEVYL